MPKLIPFVIGLSALMMTSCGNSMTRAIETETAAEAEICRTIGQKLPTRSRQDTQQTRDEIQEAYLNFKLTCPRWAHLIPA